MLVVFNQLPFQIGTGPAVISPLTIRAATAAAEVTNEIEWIMVYMS